MSEDDNKDAAGVELEGGTYEIIRKRLENQGDELRTRLEKLNGFRKDIFGSVETTLISNERISTDNNCIAQDIAVIGDKFLFGYNVVMGLKSEISLADIFAVYHYQDGTFVRDDLSLIEDNNFIANFNDFFKYYKKARFVKFTIKGHNLYFVFQIGESITDLKVFKWQINDDTLTYIDDRSVHEYTYPAQHEFEWTRTTRDMHRDGKHGHISIDERFFVETIGGDLTIKVEDNTADGSGIYEEEVEHKDQTLDDAEIHYAALGSLILLKIRPYQEQQYRYIVFNEKMQTATRIDDIEDCCILLPDDHGIIFSKGYYLQTGEYKRFDTDINDMVFERRTISPNGEDFLYTFFNRQDTIYVLLSYNLINQSVETPTVCHGYSLFNNGDMVFFKSDGEPQKHHAIQLWKTPYCHSDYVNVDNAHADHFLYKIGNIDIVRCMAECYEVLTLLNKEDSYAGLYIDIVKKATDVIDTYFWLNKEEAGNLTEPLVQIKQTSSSAIDEYEKVRTLKKTADSQSKEIKEKAEKALKGVTYAKFDEINSFVKNLAELRGLRGEIISLKEVRYINIPFLEELEAQVKEQVDKLSQKCVEFLLLDEALDPFKKLVDDLAKAIDELTIAIEGEKIEKGIVETSSELEMLIEIVSNLKIADATQTTRIIDSISTIFSKLNQIKAGLKNKIKDLMSVEGVAEFNAQMKLLNQSVINYLDVCETPANCDEYLTKVMIQLEELEGRFSEFDDFIVQITEKRDEAYNAFESKKVSLQEALNKRTTSLMSAAERILSGVKNRVQTFKEVNEINSYFAADLMIDKVRDIVANLKELGDSVKADDIEGRIKTIREDTVRQLKDKNDLYGDDNTIKLGKHKFSFNQQNLDLTIIQKDDDQFFHLTGTKFFERIEHPEFLSTKDLWSMETASENAQVYRGEYLAYKMYRAARNGELEKDLTELDALSEEELHKAVQVFMGPRYKENYVKGIHDFDAAKILRQLISISASIGLLRFSSQARALASIYWVKFADEAVKENLKIKLGSFGDMREVFPSQKKEETFIKQIEQGIEKFTEQEPLFADFPALNAAEYLFEELCRGRDFVISKEAAEICHGFDNFLRGKAHAQKFKEAIHKLDSDITGCFELVRNWLAAYLDTIEKPALDEYIDEAAALVITDSLHERNIIEVSVNATIEKMTGSHKLIEKANYSLNFNEFIERLSKFDERDVPLYLRYQDLKKELTEEYRKELRLNEFQPRILSSFVRNKLIDEVYLQLIGDNLAKQIGVAGENKRTDLMGMLLLISPPGYGKTTLMEYISNRLGLIFMKINAPAIGHHVTSLDPSEAPNAAAREEMKKLNLAFEMGDNVMIYLDDIQHSNPELLQKFISLCDGQRKIEGVYKGQPKTYDLRGRKVVVCMAGNPYNESGDKFQIPDMLANRADTYNLGDIIGDTANVFNMSYIENSLTSNSVLNKLNAKSQKDIYTFIKMAETDSREGLEFEGNYSVEDMNEINGVMKKMLVVRDVISKVNAEYIRSAAMADEYRTEPPFKMQGSYRNMNKIVEKILPVMNDNELETLIMSHYENESQTLTSGAEFNMLRFKELFGNSTEEDNARLASIRKTFEKNQLFKVWMSLTQWPKSWFKWDSSLKA
ncbi:MAG: DNA repair ATPase [Lentisphaerales bacterium]|nr:DNA repair ATPase [Lentisphaerales bacterium]